MTDFEPDVATREVVEEFFERLSKMTNLPVIRGESLPAAPPPTTISALAAGDVQRAAAAAQELQAASIKLTYPEDWIAFRARDGTEVCFLMDDGCQRIRPLWGITFDKVDFKRDFSERELEDGQYVVEAVVHAQCAISGEDHIEVGFRSSLGLFEKAWSGSTDKPVERAKVIADIRKSALRNARGRIIRTISGLGMVPKQRLIECGLDSRRIRGVQFQDGSKGGSGGYASEPQLKMICGEAITRKKVAGIDQIIGFGDLMNLLGSASMAKAKASKLIERLKEREAGSVTVEEFEQAIGAKLEYTEDGKPKEAEQGGML